MLLNGIYCGYNPLNLQTIYIHLPSSWDIQVPTFVWFSFDFCSNSAFHEPQLTGASDLCSFQYKLTHIWGAWKKIGKYSTIF